MKLKELLSIIVTSQYLCFFPPSPLLSPSIFGGIEAIEKHCFILCFRERLAKQFSNLILAMNDRLNVSALNLLNLLSKALKPFQFSIFQKVLTCDDVQIFHVSITSIFSKLQKNGQVRLKIISKSISFAYFSILFIPISSDVIHLKVS